MISDFCLTDPNKVNVPASDVNCVVSVTIKTDGEKSTERLLLTEEEEDSFSKPILILFATFLSAVCITLSHLPTSTFF
jgi:hypothetical protein